MISTLIELMIERESNIKKKILQRIMNDKMKIKKNENVN